MQTLAADAPGGAAADGEAVRGAVETELEAQQARFDEELAARVEEARQTAYEEAKQSNAGATADEAEVADLQAQLQAKVDELASVETRAAESAALAQVQTKDGIVAQVKTIMSEVVMTLHQGFDNTTSYTGKQVMSAVRKTVKKATERALEGADAEAGAAPPPSANEA